MMCASCFGKTDCAPTEVLNCSISHSETGTPCLYFFELNQGKLSGKRFEQKLSVQFWRIAPAKLTGAEFTYSKMEYLYKKLFC